VPLYALSGKVSECSFRKVCCGEGADELMLGYPVFEKNICSIEEKVSELSLLEDLFADSIQAIATVKKYRKEISRSHSLQKNSIRVAQLMEIGTKLSRYLLVQQGDRLSMSHGVEQRFPFLDEDLIDFIFSIPEEQFLRLFSSKKLLRKIMETKLPPEIINRKKQGYLAPMAEHMYDSAVTQALAKEAFSKKQRKILDMYFSSPVLEILFIHYSGQNLTNVEAIAFLVVLSTWVLHKQFFSN
jgi:asparagine synthetase B (glutamine-hydrolysing)